MRWLADENFHSLIIRGLKRRNPRFDVVRAQDVGLARYRDPELLAWAAENGRIVLTHDVRTMTHYAYTRAAQRLPMPGVVEVSRRLPIASAIDEIHLMDQYGLPEEWEGQVVYLPLR